MSSVNISLKKEAYNFLKSLKTKEKSFSDVILEFRQNDNDLMRFFGILKEVNWKEKEHMHQEFRKEFEKRL